MFTVCPKCTLTLAVTASDLRVGQGYVRCGRCSNVFNALLMLTEALGDAEAAAPAPPQADPASTSQIRQALSSAALSASSRPPITPKPSPAPASTPHPAVPAPARAPATEAVSTPARRDSDFDAIGQFEQVLQTLGISLLEEDPIAPSSPSPVPVPTSEQRPPATRQPAADSGPQLQPQAQPPLQPPWRPRRQQPGSAEADTSGYDSVENIVMEGDGVTHGAQRPADAPIDELDALTRRLALAAGEAADADAAAVARSDIVEFDLADTAVSDLDCDTSTADEREAGAAAVDLDIPGLRPAARRWPWVLGCVVLAPLLVLQALNHARQALAASPTWGAPVSRVYAALGIALRPHWNLGAYDVRQEGAEADTGAAQVIHVRLSLANRAARPQPTPLLRLTLLDRYGKRIAQRDLTPADYWPKGRAPQRFMASDERIDSEVAVRDPSAASASFELDVCLRDSGGTVHCAGDVTPLASAAVP